MTQTIKYVSIKNYKGIEDIETDIPSRFVAVFGENGAGKTSFLDAIKSAIKLEKGGNAKVKVGEDSGEIIVKFDDFEIKRVVGDKSKLEVKHNGVLVNKPQAWLDHIFLGTIGDPHKFLGLRNSEKVSYILATHGKKNEFDELEEERKKLYDERTEKHRTLLAKKEEIEKTDTSVFEDIREDNNGELEKLQSELDLANVNNKEINDLKSRIENGKNLLLQKEESGKNYVNSMERIDEEIIRLQEQKKNLQKEQTKHKEEVNKYSIAITELENQLKKITEIDTNIIQEKINKYHEQSNLMAGAKAKKEIYDQQIVARNTMQGERKELDESVCEIQEKQNALIEDIKLSYKLKVEDGQMFALDNKERIPVDQLNKAKQLEIGIDVCLGGPNKVKIITIEDANALDPETLKKIKEKIEGHNAQCFLETVYNTGYESIIIEDGKLAN